MTLDVEIPVIDLCGNLSEQELVEKVAKACSEFGFFQVICADIPKDLVKEFNDQCKNYFALPQDVKVGWKRNESNARGFFDDELTKQRRDWKQALDFGVPGSRDWTVPDEDPSNFCLDGWNQLPSEETLPQFRSVATKYFDACARFSDRIAILMAKGMGEDATTPIVQALRENHSSYLRSNYYPPCIELAEDGRKPLGISPHKDAGFLTVLLQDDDCHSLQVWKDEQWITVQPVPGAFTINTGDMAEVWSNRKYRAPLHRVLSNESKERYSAPFFYNPSYDTLVTPLSDNPLYHPILWGYFRAVRFAGDLTDLGVEIQIEDFLRSKSSKHTRIQSSFEREIDFGTPFSVEKYRDLLLSSGNDK
eukprot:scaffold880_cov132-Cylindrotheca_fusiformis.AAC.53